MAGWHHWLDGRDSGWTPGVGDRQGGLACCDSWGRKELDRTERLNWTELNWSSSVGYEGLRSPAVSRQGTCGTQSLGRTSLGCCLSGLPRKPPTTGELLKPDLRKPSQASETPGSMCITKPFLDLRFEANAPSLGIWHFVWPHSYSLCAWGLI